MRICLSTHVSYLEKDTHGELVLFMLIVHTRTSLEIFVTFCFKYHIKRLSDVSPCKICTSVSVRDWAGTMKTEGKLQVCVASLLSELQQIYS